MDRTLIRYFWHCGDNQIIEFAIMRARLNAKEKQAIILVLDDCLTQEDAAWKIGISVRQFQKVWASGVDKLLSIPWVRAYAEFIMRSS